MLFCRYLVDTMIKNDKDCKEESGNDDAQDLVKLQEEKTDEKDKPKRKCCMG